MTFGRQGPSGPRKPDSIKGEIAGTIQVRITSKSFIDVIESDPELGVTSIETHIISPTEWQFRVKTRNQGTRYFKLKLSEML